MDYAPREVIAALRAGLLERVLRSNTIWLCASCYYCTVRCPSGIRLTDVMYELKRLSIDLGLAREDTKSPIVSKLFVSVVNKNGRMSEVELISKFLLKTNPLGMFKMIPRAFSLLVRGRLPILSHKIKGISEVQNCLAAVEMYAPQPGRNSGSGKK
jgi:heterodisulfide reductase subunit C